ncbi:16S rRNA (cytosine(1402)-N(4))-methyltransferase RsmH [Candidatus Saccharibacteria bacterium]|nr:16S rRNA (cytosine(1402)-N(4))-methyltransferase RsmH [Candidatus Saccharibacteria bacterium]
MPKQKHIPVLASEVLDYLQPKKGERYLDLTAGYGGHSSLILDKIGEKGQAVLVDRDEEAIKTLKSVFAGKENVRFIHDDFLTASKQLASEGEKFDVILADLGVSSEHLNNQMRGFSFMNEGPLDMRMDPREKTTAADLINESSEDEMVKILKKYGELANAKKVAKHIIENRPYQTTTELAETVAQVVRRKKRTHPATEVFQAIRIAVNKELELLTSSLPIWIELLNTKGRLGVISFHSLEDRLVKQAFQEYGGERYDARLQIVTKKPVMSSDNEVVFNPRARSAKLRVAQRK